MSCLSLLLFPRILSFRLHILTRGFLLCVSNSAAVEDQCVNRIHRIGQTAEVVRVRKFIVTDSVEERILALQRKKQDMASDILSDNNSNGDLANSRPTLDDFKLLFGR